ncbi:MAG: DegT/DnrJ/EryC1/StrS family aminotransferase [bacterium]
MQISYLDLGAQYQSIKSEIDAAIREVIDNSCFGLDPSVSEFEAAFAEFCQAKHCIGVNNGTNALLLALKAVDIGPGDEVVTAANTFVATVAAIVHAGARPVLVDVDPDSRNLDPTLLSLALSRRTKAVIPVHLYGRMADMEAIDRVVNRHDITVIEDAAQAHGADYRGRRAGSVGRATAFSFYPAKNLGAFGEAGAVTTDEAGIDRIVRLLRDHGSSNKYTHELVGYNARMAGIQGAVLKVKLGYLQRWNEDRRRVAGWYRQQLAEVPVVLPSVDNDCRQVYHLFVIETERRDELQRFLKERGVPSLIHYPVPVHLQPAYAYLDYRRGDFPVAEKLAGEILSLPIYPELTESQVTYVCDQIREFFHRH